MTTIRFADDTNLYGRKIPAGTRGELLVSNVIASNTVKVVLNQTHCLLQFLSPEDLQEYTPKHNNTLYFRGGFSIVELEIQWEPIDVALMNAVRAAKKAGRDTFCDQRTVEFLEYMDACDEKRM